MDIVGSILAYLVCVPGIVIGLVLSFVIFFSDPGQNSVVPDQPTVLAAKSNVRKITAVSPLTNSKKLDSQLKAPKSAQTNGFVVAAKTDTPRQTMGAIDARMKSVFSKSRMRRLAERAGARHWAYREDSSFRLRFLHYDD